MPRRPQPVGDLKGVALRLVAGAVALWAALSLIGVLVTSVLGSGRGQSWDRGAVVWMAARRTGLWNTITMFGSGLANTTAAVAGELLVFLAVTATVHRPRPSVRELDAAPPTSSFPSGHTAAAMALYGCIAVLLMWTYGRRRSTRVRLLPSTASRSSSGFRGCTGGCTTPATSWWALWVAGCGCSS